MNSNIKDYSYIYQGAGGSAVILVHGMTGTPVEMKFVAKHINKKGFSVYVPTLAGHCIDESAFVQSTWQDWYNTLETTMYEALKTHDKVYVAGICVGGALGLYLAYRHPDKIRAATLYSATLNYDGWNTPFYFKYASILVPIGIRIPFIRNIRMSDAFPYGIKSERIRNLIIKNSDSMAGALPNFPAKGLHENYKLLRVIKNILPEIKTPTLLLHAKEDEVSNPRNSEYINKHLGGISELHLLEDSYHMIHVDGERAKVSDLTADFFTRY
ncbi:MAG: alpha/beta fold hydrolase [Pseudomonadota bacterium]